MICNIDLRPSCALQPVSLYACTIFSLCFCLIVSSSHLRKRCRCLLSRLQSQSSPFASAHLDPDTPLPNGQTLHHEIPANDVVSTELHHHLELCPSYKQHLYRSLNFSISNQAPKSPPLFPLRLRQYGIPRPRRLWSTTARRWLRSSSTTDVPTARRLPVSIFRSPIEIILLNTIPVPSKATMAIHHRARPSLRPSKITVTALRLRRPNTMEATIRYVAGEHG